MYLSSNSDMTPSPLRIASTEIMMANMTGAWMNWSMMSFATVVQVNGSVVGGRYLSNNQK
jgi:hypothetical protein